MCIYNNAVMKLGQNKCFVCIHVCVCVCTICVRRWQIKVQVFVIDICYRNSLQITVNIN